MLVQIWSFEQVKPLIFVVVVREVHAWKLLAVEIREKSKVAVCVALGPTQSDAKELTGGNTVLDKNCLSVSKAKISG